MSNYLPSTEEIKNEQIASTKEETIGNRIKAVCKDRGYTNEKLADAIEVERKTFGTWISGKADIKAQKLKRICQTLDVDANYILGLAAYEEPTVGNFANYSGLSLEAVRKLGQMNRKRQKERLYLISYLLTDEYAEPFIQAFYRYVEYRAGKEKNTTILRIKREEVDEALNTIAYTMAYKAARRNELLTMLRAAILDEGQTNAKEI